MILLEKILFLNYKELKITRKMFKEMSKISLRTKQIINIIKVKNIHIHINNNDLIKV